MMNILAIWLVVTSLATAPVWSPNPNDDHQVKQQTFPSPPPSPRIIVREGHRIVTVEYGAKGDGNTKISVSPHEPQQQQQQQHSHTDEKSSVETANDKIKAEVTTPPPPDGHSRSPKELMCDALGTCKHKMASVLGKAKDKVTEAEQETKEALGKAKEKVSHQAQKVSEKAKEKVSHEAQRVAEKAHSVEEEVKEALGKAKEKVSHEAKKVSEKVHQVNEEATAMLANDVKGNVSEDLEMVKEGTVKNELKEILHHVVGYMVWPVTVELLWQVVHLIGFSTAYGMCMWVTFASSYILADALPMQQFAMMQSKMYPIYFRAMAYSVGVALVGHVLTQRKSLFTNVAEMFQCYNLLVALTKILANLYFLEPRATQVMFERMKLEKEEGRGREEDSTGELSSKATESIPDNATTDGTTTLPSSTSMAERLEILNQKLTKLNACSSFLNILTLMALTWHLVYLGQRLQMAN